MAFTPSSDRSMMNVPAQVCEFLVNALQSHYEGVVLCCVESGGVSDKSRNALEAGRRKLFISQSVKMECGRKGSMVS